MQRFQDWPARMISFMRAAQDRPFARGSWDCTYFAAAHIKNITGNDFGAEFFGAYGDEAGASEIMTKHFGGTIESVATAFLGPPLPATSKAQRGDIVMASKRAGGGLGVVDLDGRHFLAVTEKDGLARFPMKEAALAWRI